MGLLHSYLKAKSRSTIAPTSILKASRVIKIRMWMLPPEAMCIKHICGEHNEIHKFRSTFVKKHSIKGRIHPIVQIEPQSMKERHDQLAKYLNHHSPYKQPDLSYLPDEERYAKVDITESARDLFNRCKLCQQRMYSYMISNSSGEK